MITHLNYIEDKELRDSLYKTLEKVFNVGNRYIAVDPEQIQFCLSRIYSFKNIPKFDCEAKGYFGVNPHAIDMKFITIFNNHEPEIYDIEKILKNWEEDQKENISDKQAEDILNKILNNFGLKVNRVFQHRFNNKFFRINKHADIEEYINNGWRVTNLYEFIDIIDDIYGDDYPTFKYNVEKQFEEFRNKEKEKTELSSETKRVIKSILNTNYTFMKIYSNENKIVLHMNLDSVPLIISTTEKTIIWFKDFIKNNTSGNKILYINRLKTFWEEYNHE
jgi:hypothetical protein